MIPVTRRIGATTTNKEAYALEPTDVLKSSDRVGKKITRMKLDVDHTPQIHKWGDREMKGTA